MKIHNCIQGTKEWHELRMGHFTASNFSRLFMKPETKGYQEIINQVVYEKITGEIPELYSNEYMERGKELEPIAREQYELMSFNKVNQIGFIEADEWIGCSPDGLIGNKGMVQIKCPKWSTLIDYHLTKEVPKDYYIQIQGELWVSEREWSDFFVFHPKLRPILKRIPRDEKLILELGKKTLVAIEIAQERIKQITKG